MPIPDLLARRYVLSDPQTALLGRGGMGDVYQGLDTHSGQPVAIKVLKPELAQLGSEIALRFQNEGEALRQLNHPNIVSYIDAVEEGGQHYLVMEYVGGGSLAAWLQAQGGRGPIRRSMQICLELADALGRAHHLGVIHRDLKPANVLLDQDGAPHLSDFGVAHPSSRPGITQTGMLVGTLDYICPEACRGEKIDARADIWSFGVMLFEILAGELPFRGETPAACLAAVLMRPPPDLQALRPEVSDALADLVYRMLEKDPQQRLPSMRLAAAELEQILLAYQDTPPGQTPPAQPGLLASYPARLTSSTSAPGRPPRSNLPAQVTPFVGRSAELAELARLLDDPQMRLLTILGLGGMGKTRLALECAAKRCEQYPDGVCYVALAPLTDPQAILAALGQALGISFQAGADPLQQVLNSLRPKRLLLVMDNFEHLLVGVSLLSELLGAAPGLQILSTSRERLNLQGELVFHLEGMDFPNWETPGDALEYSAVKLFLQSARRLRPGFELQAGDLQYVARICRQVQGMPLGILLASAWIEMLSPGEIAAELSHGLDLLAGELRDLPERQRSLRAVFEYSWGLLGPDEQSVFQSLAVFRGGFTRPAAQAVAGVTLAQLMRLSNKSLLHRQPTGRYELHELLRQFAGEKLAASPEQERTVRRLHAAWAADYMESWLPASRGPRQLEAWDGLEHEIDNITAAWDWLVRTRRPAELMRLAEGLVWYWWISGRNRQGVQALEKLAPLLEQPDELPTGVMRLRHSLWSALLMDWDFEAVAHAPLEQLAADIEPLERLGCDLRAERGLLLFLQSEAVRNNDRVLAQVLNRQAIELFEAAGRRWECANALNQATNLAIDLGQMQAAQAAIRQSYAIFQELGDPLQTSAALERMAHLEWVQGRVDEALPLLRQALEFARQTRIRSTIAYDLLQLGEGLGRAGRFAEGLPLYEEGVELFRLNGAFNDLAAITAQSSELLLHLGRYSEALQQAGQRSQWLWTNAFKDFIAGLAHLALDHPEQTLLLLDQACHVMAQLGHRENLGWTLAGRACAHLRLSQLTPGSLEAEHLQQARLDAAAALRASLETGTLFALIYALPVTVHLLAAQGETGLAQRLSELAWRYGFIAQSAWFRQVVPLPYPPPQEPTGTPTPAEALALGEACISVLGLNITPSPRPSPGHR